MSPSTSRTMALAIFGAAAAVALAGVLAVFLGRLARPPHPPAAETRAEFAPGPPSPAPRRSPAAASRPGVTCDIRLRDVTGETGIDFVHSDGSSGKKYIVETVTGGLALFDYDGDGLVDIYFLTGLPLDGAPGGVPPTNRLYRNLGGFRFVDVTERAGVGRAGFGMGVCVGDYNNDGYPDLVVNNFGPLVLYRNNGDGTFTDVTKEAGLAGRQPDVIGAGASFLDVDGDGNLDLYVANYLKFSPALNVPRTIVGVPAYGGPLDYAPVPDILYRNNGDGTFTDVSVQAGIAKHAGPGMGMVACDYDLDGDTDIFVANDGAANFLFRNDGRGVFEEVALLSGTAYSAAAVSQANMGVDAADYDNDGWPDFHVTSYQREPTALFHNLGGGLFEDATGPSGVSAAGVATVTWGNGFADFNNDGLRDLFVARGHLQDNIELWDKTTSYLARNVLLMNVGKGQFVDVSGASGEGMQGRSVGRGAGLDDLDNDGRVDVVVLNSRRPPTVLRNESQTGHHWLQIQLRGVKTNRDGVGARVRVAAADLIQVDEVHSGRGYQSHFGSRLSFGLGKRERVDRVEVHWIGGGTDVLEDVPVDRLLTIAEGRR